MLASTSTKPSWSRNGLGASNWLASEPSEALPKKSIMPSAAGTPKLKPICAVISAVFWNTRWSENPNPWRGMRRLTKKLLRPLLVSQTATARQLLHTDRAIHVDELGQGLSVLPFSFVRNDMWAPSLPVTANLVWAVEISDVSGYA